MRATFLIAASLIAGTAALAHPVFFLASLFSFGVLLAFTAAQLAVIKLRRSEPERRRPYRVPFAGVMAPAAFVVATWIIMWTGWKTDYKLGLLILLGCLFIFNREMRPELMSWRSASWLPVYLVGVGAITYFSVFGGAGAAKHHLGLWGSLGVCAAFALAIYYWAISVALPAATIQRMIDEFVAPEEDELSVPAAG